MDANALTALSPSEIRVIESRPDGTGIVEVPILSVEQEIDLGLTATGKPGKDTITEADLHQAVANFSRWPGPMPINRHPHRPMSEQGGPAPGFIDRLAVRGKQLWARIDLTAELFAEVAARMWRGFSVDYGRGVTLPTGAMEGFVVAGGVFTNRPASDVHFKLAGALAGEFGQTFVELRHSAASERKIMDDVTVKLATAEAQVAAGDAKIKSLEAKLEEANKQLSVLDTRATEAERIATAASSDASVAKLMAERREGDAKDAESKIASLETANKKLRDESLSKQVVSLCRRAISTGVPPATLKAMGDYEKESLKWLRDNFASLEAAERWVGTLPKTAAMSSTNSGYVPDADNMDAVSPEIATELRRRGLDPAYANLSRADELPEKK